MQPVVITEPYRFVPPYRGRVLPRLLQLILPSYLRRNHGITQIHCEGGDCLRDLLAAGVGVLLAPNHCRPEDPLVVSELCRRVGTTPYTMASWHVFMQGWAQRVFSRLGGGFSVYREGLDRQALNTAIEILVRERRPLVIFPEGAISRHNDRLNPLMEGPPFIARSAAKRRAESGGRVVVLPVALRYRFGGDVGRAIAPVLDRIERRLSWGPTTPGDLVQRIRKVGLALLSLKEIEYLSEPQLGTLWERVDRLIENLLAPLEREWLKGRRDNSTITRVKSLRVAIVPEMVQGELPEPELARRWTQLAQIYLAQQLSLYPADSIQSNPTPERLIETVQRFEEDLTDTCEVHAPWQVTVRVGQPIPVSTTRDRTPGDDPLLAEISRQLQQLLEITTWVTPVPHRLDSLHVLPLRRPPRSLSAGSRGGCGCCAWWGGWLPGLAPSPSLEAALLPKG
ncbi:MAG: 1-acyl-sn-glycerol-3-phosphate acyltransferase [Planctomycetaceae bacterium]